MYFYIYINIKISFILDMCLEAFTIEGLGEIGG